MKITSEGTFIGGMYQSVMPYKDRIVFIDRDGAKIYIDVELVKHLYSIWDFHINNRD